MEYTQHYREILRSSKDAGSSLFLIAWPKAELPLVEADSPDPKIHGKLSMTGAQEVSKGAEECDVAHQMPFDAQKLWQGLETGLAGRTVTGSMTFQSFGSDW